MVETLMIGEKEMTLCPTCRGHYVPIKKTELGDKRAARSCTHCTGHKDDEEFLRSLSDDDPRWGCDSKYYGSRVYDLRDSNLDMGYMEDDDYSE